MSQGVPKIDELLRHAQYSALHLEMRDGYMQDAPALHGWRAGHRLDPDSRASWWRPWLDVIAETVGRRVEIRRARIVSEPVSEYTSTSAAHACPRPATRRGSRTLFGAASAVGGRGLIIRGGPVGGRSAGAARAARRRRSRSGTECRSAPTRRRTAPRTSAVRTTGQ
ncbi:DUF6879 family protein [Streptomyces sp. CBMA123]|uniref:DUF6879 family protein n=1 Tax=Streptomyces sp. CBMA123 TaxID=1896313 RepID=UPI0039839DEF